MDLHSVEERLARAPAAPVLVDPRLLRRIIKRHRVVPGLGLEVPHARCYAIARETLLTIVAAAELGPAGASLPDDVILLPRPTEAELRYTPVDVLLTQLWRGAFHAAVHLEIERRGAAGGLTAARIRERIHRIGETEFDEVRLVLRHDESLLPPYDDRETFTEFAALYLELRSFDPGLLDRLFPTLRDRARVDGAIDIDAAPLLALTRPEGLPEVPERTSSIPPSVRARASIVHAPEAPRAPSLAACERYLARAAAARRTGNDVRAALLALTAHAVAPPDQIAAALAAARDDLDALAVRLDSALSPERPPTEAERETARVAWTPILLALARSGFRRTLRHTVSARLLLDLQSAAVARERPQSAVDLVEFALSLGRRPIVRPLPAAIDVRIIGYLRRATLKLRFVTLDPASHRVLGTLLRQAGERAEENARATLRPRLIEALDAVGLAPRDAPERLARAKLTDELLDQAVHHGFLGIGHLRDAISRNQLKLESLSGPRELLFGDPLLKADRRLGIALDGVYRRAEIYLRTLQRLSSVAFGTAPGRLLTLYLILPVGGAFVILEGLSHLISLIIGLFGHHHLHLLNRLSLAAVSVALFCLLHSAAIRAFVLRVLLGVAWVLKSVFVRFPQFVANLPAVKLALGSLGARGVIRYLIKPGMVTFASGLLAYWLIPPARALSPGALAGIAAGVVLALDLGLISPIGLLVEEAVDDWIAQRLRLISREVLPGALRLIASLFRYLTDLVERMVYTVDEWLRFREGQSVISLVAKAVLGLGWFFVAYALRIYVNLLIEPQINPIKHFPVVTVSHKIVLPMAHTIFLALESVLAPVLGGTVARAIAGPTVLLIPGVFGFLVWELKENWKLYAENRARTLGPAAIGHHGETMGALMKPGFHSGTLPKLYQKLRRSTRSGDGSHEAHDEALHEVEEAVRHFGSRELAAIINGSSRFHGGRVRVDAVELGSNRITLVVSCGSREEAHSPESYRAPAKDARTLCRIAFEEQSGLVLASVPEAGWLDGLGDEDRVIVENALAGLYHFAGVDVAREQLDAALRGGAESAPPYDIGSGGLVVWPEAEGPKPDDTAREDREYVAEIFYDFRGGATLYPVTRGDPPAEPSPTLVSAEIFYAKQPLTWSAWVAAWNAASSADGVIPRLLGGASILPKKALDQAQAAAAIGTSALRSGT
ncbi:MAG: hypothetical protein ABJE95_26540 [Byssovorax sp.]